MDPKDSKLVELRSRLVELDSLILGLAERDTLDTEEEARWEDLTTERDAIFPEYKKLEERAARVSEIRTNTYRSIHDLPEAKSEKDKYFGVDVRTQDWRWARDGALRILEDRDNQASLSRNQMDLLDRQVRDASYSDIARRIIVTENEHYRSAFGKLMAGRQAMTQEENVALLRYDEYRAQVENTQASGGYAVPVLIDPTIILTDQETDNPFLALASVKDVNTNLWTGVSSAGLSWSFDTESTVVSDDSLTSMAQPSVRIHMARGFIPYSIEVEQDWAGFQGEMGKILAAGYDELLVSKFSTGSGTNEPYGVITALDATAGSEVTSTTDGAFGFEDVYKVWKNLPQKYRRNASWMMSVDINNKIRQFGASNVYHAATVALPAGAAEILFGRPVYENPYFPDFDSTTGAVNRLVIGDFSNYVIARRAGMNVELAPLLVDVTYNRPTGQRGWFAWARIGGNVVNTAGFRLLQNQ